jgi:2-polyprenyl-6-methoxyphenol hydroxylase-like FAD-dependent oxidoreductase
VTPVPHQIGIIGGGLAGLTTAHRLGVLQWFWAYVTMQRSVRLITDDDKVWGAGDDRATAGRAS